MPAQGETNTSLHNGSIGNFAPMLANAGAVNKKCLEAIGQYGTNVEQNLAEAIQVALRSS